MNTKLNLNCILNQLNKVLHFTPWKTNIQNNQIIKQSIKAFKLLTKNKTKSKTIHRLCGQSGTGKTSQLLPSIQTALQQKNNFPIILAVRCFAPFHPNYNKLAIKNKKNLRENTNGFALRCLFLCTVLCLKNGYSIVYDVTLLNMPYEKLLEQYLKQFGYQQIFHLIALHPSISNFFIKKRTFDKNNKEFGRKIKTSSKKFFIKTLTQNLKYKYKTKQNTPCIVWSPFLLKPVFIGPIKNCYSVYKKYRKVKNKIILPEIKLLESKTTFYKNYIKIF